MTINRDLKQLIRQRMAKTGEPYTVARRHVLNASGKLCPACSGALVERTVLQMPDIGEDGVDDLTDGQAADYFSALESNDPRDWGEWAEEVVEKFCPRCEERGAAQLEALLLRARQRPSKREE
ncbi:MAG: hypothetical protein JNJ54_04575 [Myxococcaceae bacterium]|nr:hypothetical protein [Myxococcaceae bacterium]